MADGREVTKTFASLATWLSRWMGSLWAVLVTAALVGLGLATVGIVITALVISVTTLLMVYALQNTENRHLSALHLKLDEIIIHLEGPRDDVAGIQAKSHEEIEELEAELHESREATNTAS
jgi:low affinity Fe/Cu permease